VRAAAPATDGALSDYLRPGLRLVFVGINPGLRSAAAGHHYAGPGNHFWPLLYESALVGERLTYEDDARVLEWGIGLTNIVARPSASSSDLSPAELRAGAAVLRQKLARFAPMIAAFNGKVIYRAFTGHDCAFGLQAEAVGGTRVFVMPSTSARTVSFQRADKLRYFRELARLVRDAECAP
jgi:TDG/mug DNA glycosylase family protein